MQQHSRMHTALPAATGWPASESCLPCLSPGSSLSDTGVIQATQRDEFAYQEMIAHLPMCALEVSSDDRGEDWAGGELKFQG